MEQGAAVSIEQTVHYPHALSDLVLFGSYALVWRIDATEAMDKDRELALQVSPGAVRRSIQ